jgi:hypothetical protein
MKIFGFEDYNAVRLYENLLNRNTIERWDFGCWSGPQGFVGIPVDREYVEIRTYTNGLFINKIFREHKEVLDKAKTVYVHPSCTLSRNLVYLKYKKASNPFLADVVVIPKVSPVDVPNVAVFVNESKKGVFYIEVSDGNNYTFNIGSTLRSMMPCSDYNIHNLIINGSNIKPVVDSVLEYYGPLAEIRKKDSFLVDILTHSLPKDKLVYEDTIMKTLSNEDNQITFESMCSIYDMLQSTDADTVGAAIKALSTMDYMNYPCSVKFVFQVGSSMYMTNKATNSTAAKYMFKQLTGGTARRWMRIQEDTISQKDYDLFKKMVQYTHKNMSEDDVMQYISNYNFAYKDNNFVVHPRISG